MAGRRIWCTRASRARVEAALAALPSAPAVEELQGLPSGCSPEDVVVADYEALPPEERRGWVEGLLRLIPASRLVWLSSGDYRKDLIWLLERGAATHVLAGSALVGDDLRCTLAKLLAQELFGAGCYVPSPEWHKTLRLSRSDQKAKVLRAIEELGAALQIHPRLLEHLKLVGEELFTNAIYNAPVDSSGRHRYHHFDRTQPVVLSPGESVQLELLGNRSRVALAMTDSYGSLSPSRFFDSLARCLRRGEEQIEPKKGGAGLGLFQIFESVTQLVLNLQPGRRTELLALLELGGSFKEFSRAPKSLNVFIDTQEERPERTGPTSASAGAL